MRTIQIPVAIGVNNSVLWGKQFESENMEIAEPYFFRKEPSGGEKNVQMFRWEH